MLKIVTKLIKIILPTALILLLAQPCLSIELEDGAIYKHLGSHKITYTEGMRLFYPENLELAIPRIVEKFVNIKKNLLAKFPPRTGLRIDVILTNHDDCVDFVADANLDILKLEVFEEMGFLSSRGYSLERRFAHKLANVLILKNLTATSNFIGRKIGQLAVPQWFLEGMTMHYSFSMDALQHSRVMDLARTEGLYDLRQLATIDSQPAMIQEEMMFQAHSMISYWDGIYKKDAAIQLMRRVYKNPSNFINLFKKVYGVTLYEAYNSYVAFMTKKAKELREKDYESYTLTEAVDEREYFRSFKKLALNEEVWVSSKRYSTETYDLFYKKDGAKPIHILKNVHPILIYDEQRRSIIIGKYYVNSKKERRLGLWSINLDTFATKCLVNGPGSFKPLGIRDDRSYFVSIKNGITRIMSVNLTATEQEAGLAQVDYSFPPEIRPLDICMDTHCSRLYYITETHELKTKLSMMECTNFIFDKKATDLFVFDGIVNSLVFKQGSLWFAGEDQGTAQLFRLNEQEASIEKYTDVSGGVWEIGFTENKIEMLTYDRGSFKLLQRPIELPFVDSKPILAYEVAPPVSAIDMHSKPYSSIYATGYWMPMFGQDAQGKVFGIRTFQKDLLGRSSYEINPTYGFSSKDWGYMNVFSQRMGITKLSLFTDRVTAKNSYLNNKYYERSIRQQLELETPLNLASKLRMGLELVDRSIVRLDYDTTKYATPTVGQDNSFYVKYSHIGIRTEPYASVFPRKGREITADFHHGTSALAGDMKYDSMLLTWREHMPLSTRHVLTCNFVLGEDSKEENLRRPEDLYIGGKDHYLRAYPGSYKNGDRMRVFSCHLGQPISFRFPRMMSWVYNEFTSAEVFFEMGDAISSGSFDWMYDRGAEMRSRVMFLKRLPLVVKLGHAIQNGGSFKNTYAFINYEELAKLIQ
jgi:hypothetical protein